MSKSNSGFKNWREENLMTDKVINDCVIATRVDSLSVATVARYLQMNGKIVPGQGISAIVRLGMQALAEIIKVNTGAAFEDVDESREYLTEFSGSKLNSSGRGFASQATARQRAEAQRGGFDPAYGRLKTLKTVETAAAILEPIAREDIPQDMQDYILKVRDEIEAKRAQVKEPMPTPEQMTGPQPGQPGGSGEAVYDMTVLKNTFADQTAAPLAPMTQPQGAASSADSSADKGAANGLNEEDKSNGDQTFCNEV